MRSDRAEPAEQGTTEAIRERFQRQRQETSSTQSDGNQSVTNWRRNIRDSAGVGASSSLLPRERRIRTIPDTQQAASIPSNAQPPASVIRQRRDYRDGNYKHWSSWNWRNDHRYDWRRYRDRHRSIFRLGFYYDPFGWSYRRWNSGWYMWPSYYSSRYWLHDPWYYRLPPAYGPYRWVRYWNDALLVNIYTGEVVDVLHGFFW